MKSPIYYITIACAVVAIAAVGMGGCNTIVPDNHSATVVEYDGTRQDAGLVAAHFDPNGQMNGYIWSASLRDKYNGLLDKWGAILWTPAPDKDDGVTPITSGRYAGNFLATQEAMTRLVTLVQEDLRRGSK